MTLIQGLFLGIIQGVTEFFPISSDGHLNLVQSLFQLTPSLSFDIFLNTATFLAVLFYFRRQTNYFFKNLPYIIIASLPVAIIGFFFKDYVAQIAAYPQLLPFFFLISSVLVFSIKFIYPKNQPLNYFNSLVIGFFQALAILPGVSRSAGTIASALFLGLSPATAFNFSFAIYLPASLGALLLDFKNFPGFTLSTLTVFLVTFFVGLLSLGLLKQILARRQFWLFGFYTFFLSILLLLFPLK